MNNNIISSYMNYKLNRLKTYAFTFLPNDNKTFLEENFTAYLSNYIKVYYYHILESLNYSEAIAFDQRTIEEEFSAIKLELLDNLKEQELTLSNELYQYAKELITETKNISLIVTYIDRLVLNTKEEITDKIKSLSNQENLNRFFTDDIEEILIREIKETFITENKFFKDITSDDFKLRYKDIKNTEDLKILDLSYYIKILESNYKKKLVAKTFNEEVLSFQKNEVMIKHISKEILLKTLNKDEIKPVFIEFNETLFSKKNNSDKLFNLLNNKLLKENIYILITFNTYSNNKSYLEKYSEYHFACLQDLSHINDINVKLNTIENTNFFDYIVINGYRDRDKDFIDKYEPTIARQILFYEGD